MYTVDNKCVCVFITTTRLVDGEARRRYDCFFSAIVRGIHGEPSKRRYCTRKNKAKEHAHLLFSMRLIRRVGCCHHLTGTASCQDTDDSTSAARLVSLAFTACITYPHWDPYVVCQDVNMSSAYLSFFFFSLKERRFDGLWGSLQ